MAVIVDQDSRGIWAALECDGPNCERHVSARPMDGDVWSVGDIVATVCEWGAEEGWVLRGWAWCPEHVPAVLQRSLAATGGREAVH